MTPCAAKSTQHEQQQKLISNVNIKCCVSPYPGSKNTLTLGNKLYKCIPCRKQSFCEQLSSDFFFFTLPFRGNDRKCTPFGLRKDVPSSPSCFGLFSKEVFPPASQQMKNSRITSIQDCPHQFISSRFSLHTACPCDLSGVVVVFMCFLDFFLM